MKKNIGKYEIIQELSKGATTTVYKAYQTSLSRYVILKILNQHLLNEEDIVSRFQREARACAKINHNNIVNIYDYGIEDGIHFIAMEYVQGFTLKYFIENKIRLPVDIFLFIANEILSGLAFAHKNGIYHRDIKPANILISHDGKVKISDFGLALIADSQTITLQNTILGTPAYMSPEQISGENLDQRTDIFSLGATFYELLTFQGPFTGKNYSETLNNVLNKEPEKLDSLVSSELQSVSRIIHRMLAKKRSDRYSSCESISKEFIAIARANHIDLSQVDLKNFITAPEKYASKFAPEPLQSKTTRANFLKAGAAIIFLLLLILIAIYFKGRDNLKNIHPVKNNEKSNSMKIDSLSEENLVSKDSLITNLPIAAMPKNRFKEVEKQVIQEKAEDHIQQGWLFIKCTPWAEILIDDEFAAIVSETDTLLRALSPGKHEIIWINNEFAPMDTVKKIIDIQAKDTLFLVKSFYQLADIGTISVDVIPWAELYLDEKKIGVTPLDPILAKSGEHRIVLKHPTFGTREQNLYLRAGEFKKIRINFLHVN